MQFADVIPTLMGRGFLSRSLLRKVVSTDQSQSWPAADWQEGSAFDRFRLICYSLGGNKEPGGAQVLG